MAGTLQVSNIITGTGSGVDIDTLAADINSKLPLTGGTITGELRIQSNTTTNSALEIGRIDGVTSEPLIDFHSGSVPTDFDARILASGGTGASGGGALAYTAYAGHNFFGSIRTNQGIDSSSSDTTHMLSVSGRNYQMALTTAAQSIFDGNNGGLAEGSYLVYVAVDNYMVGGGEYNEHYIGLMYWFPYGTNSSVADEIPLHRMGHAPNNGRVHLRTSRAWNNAPGVLQIWSDVASGTANYYLAFKRIM